MTVYIKGFRFGKRFGRQVMCFRYFTGFKWKKLVVGNDFNRENVTVYSRYVLDCIVNDVCGGEKDSIKRDSLLRDYQSRIDCVEQLDREMFNGATKIFS